MQISSIDKAALARQGVEALRLGQAQAARELFERIAAAGLADAATYVGLAYARRLQRDPAGAMDAVNEALTLEPLNTQALIVKADFLGEAGDARGAAAFYRAAVRGVPRGQTLPADLRREVERADAMCAKYAGQFEAFLEGRLADRGLASGSGARRFRDSLELLFGRKEIYFQRPRYYFFPGLPQIQFFERERFPWLAPLEAATGAIRAELLEVLKDGAAFRPYVEGDLTRPRKEQAGMLDNPDWSAFYLWKNGELVAENAARCPATMRALEHIPLTRVQNRSPSVLFSLLRPGAHIPAHNGMVNTRLIGHLPLVVPGQCTFRVGNETRDWVEGKAWLFDDTMEHEAWNRSSGLRVVLLFEVWRPELSDEERGLVNAMFESIDAHMGEKPAWEI
jgi:aspartyl/asparaginyl beta-hydroxylase (cupin superfamily)